MAAQDRDVYMKPDAAKPVAAAPKPTSILDQLADALHLAGHGVAQVTHGGKTIDQTVDEAVAGAKGANPDY